MIKFYSAVLLNKSLRNPFRRKSQPIDTQGHSCPTYYLVFCFGTDDVLLQNHTYISLKSQRAIASYITVNISIAARSVITSHMQPHLYNYSHAIIATLLVIIRASYGGREGVKKARFFS